MNTQTRSEIIAKFKEEVKNGKILVGVGAVPVSPLRAARRAVRICS